MDDGLTLMLGALALACGATAAKVWRQTRRASASRHWPSVEGRILSSSVERETIALSDSSGPPHPMHDHWAYVPRVRFAYSVAGREYQGEVVTFGKQGPFSRDAGPARRVVERYPEGAAVRVFVDPSQHGTACLERAEGSMAIGLAVSGLMGLTAIGLMAVPFAF